MSFRYAAGINKPGFNPLGAQTTTFFYNLYSWGDNQFGQLGLGNITNYSSPKQVGSLTEWLTIAGNRYYNAAVKTNGTLWTWGRNNFGQLGHGNTTSYSSPKQVGALTSWASLGLGSDFMLAIKTDGTLWSWGRNQDGALGLGNLTNYNSPKQVGALTNWSKVTAADSSTLAIKTDGTLWAWGFNLSYGQLGLGNTTGYSSPKQVGALTNWSFVSAGAVFTSAIKTDGTLWVWGGNYDGFLGLGNTTSYSSPKQVGALTTWLNIASGYCTLATQTNGTLWSWGSNLVGILGLGNTTYYSSPKQIGALTTWLKVHTRQGILSSFAIKTDGTLWGWGRNNLGQLGLNNTTNYSSPKQVGSSTWNVVSGSSLALG